MNSVDNNRVGQNARPAGRIKSALLGEQAIYWLAAGLTAFFVLAPIVPVIIQAFVDRPLYESDWQFTFQNFVDFFTYDGVDSLSNIVWNTIIFSVIMTAVAQIIGTITAIIVGRTDLPLRGTFSDVLLWPLFVSHLIMGVGWLTIYGSAGYLTQLLQMNVGWVPWNIYSVTGMAVVAGLAQAPLTYIYVLYGSVNLADPSLEEAARTTGAKPLRILWSVTIPLARPAIIYSTMLNFVIGIEMLSIPLLFGEPENIDLFSTFLYHEGKEAIKPNMKLVAAASMILVIVVAALIWLQTRWLQGSERFETVRGKSSHPRRFKLGKLKWPLFTILALYVFFTILLPLAAVVLRSVVSFLTPMMPFWELFTFEHYKQVFHYPSHVRAITNTIMISVIGAGLGTCFYALIALVTQRSTFKHRVLLEYIALIPRAIPGLIAGIGIFYAIAILPMFSWLQNTMWILVVAYVMSNIPTGVSILSPPLYQIGKELDESARTSGASWWQACYAVVLPLLKPTMFSCYILLFVIFLRLYTTPLFLYSSGSEVMGVSMLLLWNAGENGPVAVFASLQIFMTLGMVYIAKKIWGVKIYG